MFEGLQNKWKVSGGRLILIIATFAIGGSLCGYAGRKLLGLTNIDKGVLWVILYIVLITILWPLAVILVSIPTGQFAFFKKYLKKMGQRISKRRTVAISDAAGTMNIAIFASGAGSNAEKIINNLPASFSSEENQPIVNIAVIITNNSEAGVLGIAKNNNIPAEVINLTNKTTAELSVIYSEVLKKYRIDFIILAGYLKKIPDAVINTYRNRIVNIHPALLPAYGGPGMYGKRVHEAVINAKEKQSGISIHYVDEIYDHGKIIFQSSCDIEENETPDSLAKKIHALEHENYAGVIADVIRKIRVK